ncbi:histone acetyltransferase HPA2 [Solibacillus silvestris StLB046]|uniref:Histone acetyltransferase HPA2 n=1 Tax=Solibacillus silvestris (strain StLB046) TaxID=1002809 RepID=F2F990_SOLSS|nr:GNAT family N-acetyltransferase [Solibacillus silvestris]BAK16617.1 histone acetyltransferase HPA2 [Solibacillus silvestris StLB046]
MELKRMKESDLATCTETFIKVFNAEPWNDNWNDESAHHYLSDYYNTPNFLGVIAIENDVLLGFIMGVQRKWYSGDEYFIHEMCVDQTLQNKGIGKAMLNYLEIQLKEKSVESMTLLTNRNIPAEHFYKNNGFDEIERLVFLYKEIK